MLFGTALALKELAAAHPEISLFFHARNYGKGGALRTAFRQVKGDIVIVQDADLEYDPADYGILLVPLLDGRADVVYGSRFLGGPHRVHLFWHYVANRGLTTLSNMFTNLNLTDMETCYKAFRSEILEELVVSQDRFGFEPEFTARVAHQRLRVYEVPISYSGRDYEEGKKIRKRDGLVAVAVILGTHADEILANPELRWTPAGLMARVLRPLLGWQRGEPVPALREMP